MDRITENYIFGQKKASLVLIAVIAIILGWIFGTISTPLLTVGLLIVWVIAEL